MRNYPVLLTVLATVLCLVAPAFGQQIQIKALFVEVDVPRSGETGAEWIAEMLDGQIAPGDRAFSSLTTITHDDLKITFGNVAEHLKVEGAIAEQIESAGARMLASPTVTTVAGRPAAIHITSEIAYTDPEADDNLTDSMEVGLTLSVTPSIENGEDIIIDLDAQNSELEDGNFEGVPTLNRRGVRTNISARDGGTLFVSGLRRYGDTELVVFLTCTRL